MKQSSKRGTRIHHHPGRLTHMGETSSWTLLARIKQSTVSYESIEDVQVVAYFDSLGSRAREALAVEYKTARPVAEIMAALLVRASASKNRPRTRRRNASEIPPSTNMSTVIGCNDVAGMVGTSLSS